MVTHEVSSRGVVLKGDRIWRWMVLATLIESSKCMTPIITIGVWIELSKAYAWKRLIMKHNITMMSWWAPWRLKSPASPLFASTSNFNFKRLYSTQIYKGKAKTCVLHSNVWRLLLRYMHTACIRATKKIIDWMTFILHTITYDQRNQTSYTDAQNLSQWRTVWIMGHEWFDVKRKYKGSGKSNSVQYKIYKPICRLYEIAGACYWAKLSR